MLMKRLLIACGILGIIAGLICRVTLLTTSFEYDELFTAVTSNPAVAFDYIDCGCTPPSIQLFTMALQSSSSLRSGMDTAFTQSII